MTAEHGPPSAPKMYITEGLIDLQDKLVLMPGQQDGLIDFISVFPTALTKTATPKMRSSRLKNICLAGCLQDNGYMLETDSEHRVSEIYGLTTNVNEGM